MKPTLILVSGPPGVGKSTLASALSRKLRVGILDKDCIDEPFSPHDRGPRYSRVIEPRVLQALLNLAERNLEIKNSILIDLPWTHILINSPRWKKALLALSKRTRVRLVVLECSVSEAELKRRIQGRGLKRDRPKLSQAGWKNFKKRDKIGARIPLPHTALDLELPFFKVLRAAIQSLRS